MSLYPNNVLVEAPDPIELWSVWPDVDDPGRCLVRIRFMVRPEILSPAMEARVRKSWDILREAGMEEDFPMEAFIQENARAWPEGHFQYGANENRRSTSTASCIVTSTAARSAAARSASFGERRRPPGSATTMIKMIFCLHRRADFSAEGFQAYWRDRHAPLVREVAPLLRMRRYVQSRAFDDPRIAAPVAARGATVAGYDGVAELYWDSVEDILAAGESKDARDAGRRLLADERAFIDLARSPLFWVREDAII